MQKSDRLLSLGPLTYRINGITPNPSFEICVLFRVLDIIYRTFRFAIGLLLIVMDSDRPHTKVMKAFFRTWLQCVAIFVAMMVTAAVVICGDER